MCIYDTIVNGNSDNATTLHTLKHTDYVLSIHVDMLYMELVRHLNLLFSHV